VLAAEADLPGRLAAMAPHMIAEDWLGSYRDFRVIERVLQGISRRLSRPEGLAGAFDEVQALYEPLSEDFRAFYPVVQGFAQEMR
jgi:acyl carrier protein phosphodiesterase